MIVIYFCELTAHSTANDLASSFSISVDSSIVTKALVVETEAKSETAGFETEAKAEAVASETEAEAEEVYLETETEAQGSWLISLAVSLFPIITRN